MANNERTGLPTNWNLEQPEEPRGQYGTLHAFANNDGGMWTCLCQKSFGTKPPLIRHIAKETGQFACPEPDCSTKSGSKDDLDRHLREKHQQGKNNEPVLSYFCGVVSCKRYSQVFRRKHNLLEHYKKTHPWHGEVFLNRDPLTGILRGSDVPMSGPSSKDPPNAVLEAPYPNIGTYLDGYVGTLDFNEDLQFSGMARAGHDLSTASGIQQAVSNDFGYFEDSGSAGAGLLAARSNGVFPAQDRFQLHQDLGDKGSQMQIQRRIAILEEEKQRSLQDAQEKEEKIAALQRALEVLKE